MKDKTSKLMRSYYLPSPGTRSGGGHLDQTPRGLCLGLCDWKFHLSSSENSTGLGFMNYSIFLIFN